LKQKERAVSLILTALFFCLRNIGVKPPAHRVGSKDIADTRNKADKKTGRDDKDDRAVFNTHSITFFLN
jgi:hypothetical protein